MQDEGPELHWPDRGCSGGKAFGGEESIEVSDAVGDDGYGPVALALGSGAKPVALDQPG